MARALEFYKCMSWATMVLGASSGVSFEVLLNNIIDQKIKEDTRSENLLFL